jgi:hypothetical protein
MNSILEFLRRLIDLIFSGSSPEAEKRKRLRDLSSELRSMSPPYYDPRSKEVLPGLASVVFKLSRVTKPIRQITLKTICSEDTQLSGRYWDYLIEARLPEPYHEKRQRFTYEEMKKRTAGISHTDAELKRMASEAEDFLGVISDIDAVSFNDGCDNLARLANVCQFNFRSLLSRFDNNFDEKSRDYKPSFRPAAEDDVLPQLMDFFYVAADLSISREVELNLSNLLDRLRGNKAESHKETINKATRWLRECFERYLSTEVMADLLRVIKKDPDYVPKRDESCHDYLEEFKRRFRERYDRNVERITRELDERLIAMDLSSLFRNAELLEIDAYNEETNNLLLQHDFQGFTHVKALQIVKSFIAMKFEKDLKDVIKRILVDGFFEDKMFQQSMSTSVYECENALSLILEFERNLQDREKDSVRELKRHLQLLRQGKNVVTSLNKLIEAIDTRAGEIVETVTNYYNKLQNILAEVLNDFKLRTPIRVANIKVLGGNRNNEMIKLLIDRRNDISRFINIMKHFTVVQTQAFVQKQEQDAASR